MRASRVLLTAVGLIAATGCEDGPAQIFEPNHGDPALQNGFDTTPWVQDGTKGFDDLAGGDRQGRARFCDEAESTELIQGLVTQPIVPDVSLGGIPLWGADGQPLHADTLLGRPEDGKFCDSSGVYSNAFVWGPTNEIIVFFNEETRLVESIAATQAYLGALEASYTKSDGSTQAVTFKPRERVLVGGRELDTYASRAEQAAKRNSWLNEMNVTEMYRAVRESFFGQEAIPDGFNCVASSLCDIIYTASDESVPQETYVVMQDSGVTLGFSPDGYLTIIFVEPVRVAPFEVAVDVGFGEGTTVAPRFQSTSTESCGFNLGEDMTWSQFQSRCVDDDRTLSRVSYDVHTQRDAVDVNFNGVTLSFLRAVLKSAAAGGPGVFHDGEAPDAEDTLYSIQFTRSLSAHVREFVPATLAGAFTTRLEDRLHGAVAESAPADHPFRMLDLEVPDSLGTEPQRIGELMFEGPGGEASWIPSVLETIHKTYEGLTPEQQAQVDARVLDPVYLIEPFVDSVLSAFSHGQSESTGAFKVFQTTTDHRWSIGYAHFLQGGIPYRITVQYSLNFGAVTAVSIDRGYSDIDEVLNGINQVARDADGTTSAYFDLSLARGDNPANPYSLGASGIEVMSFDRRLGTLDVMLQTASATVPATVTGTPLTDRSGYMRQIRGERFEFVPAHTVYMYGKETSLLLYVEADGTIGRIVQNRFKGSLELCDGLSIHYGEDVRARVESWRLEQDAETYGNCELVFNYSTNGNLLESVASLSNKISFGVVADRATSAAIWR